MKTMTSKLKIFATLLISTVVAFLCPLNKVYAITDIGSYKDRAYVTRFWTGYKVSEWTLSDNRFGRYFSHTQNSNTDDRGMWFEFNKNLNVSTNNIIQFDYLVVTGDYVQNIPRCPFTNDLVTILDCNVNIVSYSQLQSLESNFVGYSETIGGTTQYGNLHEQYSLNYEDINFYYFQVLSRLNRNSTSNTLYYQTSNTCPVKESDCVIYPSWFTISENNGDLSRIVKKMDELSAKLDQQNDNYEDSKQDIQQEQQNAQNNGSISQQQADSSGQTLLGAFTSFIGAITNASPGNCSFTLNTGYGFNLGEVNLCSISPPSSFQVISSLVVIGFAVPLSISASKKMIDLFRGFTG